MIFGRNYMLFLDILLIYIGLAGCTANVSSFDVVVENTGISDRNDEIVEIPLDEIRNELHISSGLISVVDDSGNRISSQITHDSLLIFPVSVSAASYRTYIVSCDDKSFSMSQFRTVSSDTISCGRVYPERLDDLAWENDKSAYRLYGPAFERNGNKGYGYDILAKRVSSPVLESRYRMQLDSLANRNIIKLRKSGQTQKADSISRSISYHIDHGNGMDCYNVGPTLGGGATALFSNSEILYPNCYSECEILDNGPIRFSARLRYNPLTVGNDSNIVETRTITLNKGSYLNRTEVSYSGISDDHSLMMTTGIVVHSQNSDGYYFDKENKFMAYADSTNNSKIGNGVIFVGALFEKPVLKMELKLFENKKSDAIGHILAFSEYNSEIVYRYYWGSGWSKGDMPDNDSWNLYLKDFSYKLSHPLVVNIKKHLD